MVAFALLMTPFAANPLIYVASDPNYRRCPQIDAATISFKESSIKEPTESLAELQVVRNISGLTETAFASRYEETPRLRSKHCFLLMSFSFLLQSSHSQGWTTPTALRSVRHSVVELVHPTLAIGSSSLHQALFTGSRTHTTSCSSV